MKIVIWHGYLLGGTGSNVYTRQLAREWSRAGHDVTVLSQEPHPERYDLGDAAVVRPDVGGLLPAFVLDHYEGYRVELLQDCSREELDVWVEANAAAVRDQLPADFLLCNHVLLGGAVGRASGATYAVKAHGSELEYSMRGRPGLEAWGREVLEAATTAVSLARRTSARWSTRSAVRSTACTRFRRASTSRSGARNRARLRLRHSLPKPAAIRRIPATRTSASRTSETPSVSQQFLAGDEPTVVYFGKLLHNKGVHVLLDALAGLDARVVVVGFGDYRAELEQLATGQRVLFTGPLEHRHLVHLLALADACVVPSIFPEAFGMVAAEAAAAGCPPLVARHSGLAEVAEGLEAEYPPALRGLTSFASGDALDLRQKLTALLALSPAERDAIRAAARRAAVERWSWKSVADRLLELGR